MSEYSWIVEERVLYVPNNNFAYIDHKTIIDLDHTCETPAILYASSVFHDKKRCKSDSACHAISQSLSHRDGVCLPCVHRRTLRAPLKHTCKYIYIHITCARSTWYTGTGSSHTYTHTCVNRHTGDRCLCCHCCFSHDTSEWCVRFASLSRCRCIVFSSLSLILFAAAFLLFFPLCFRLKYQISKYLLSLVPLLIGCVGYQRLPFENVGSVFHNTCNEK